jgi:hypothetical protein
MSEGPEVADARPGPAPHSRRVQQALRTADRGEAYHWPTIAATLAREVRRLAALTGPPQSTIHHDPPPPRVIPVAVPCRRCGHRP